MALGTPCVSTAVTGIPEIVRHGETGLIVPERDPEALADALRRLLVRAARNPSGAERAPPDRGRIRSVRKRRAPARAVRRQPDRPDGVAAGLRVLK